MAVLGNEPVDLFGVGGRVARRGVDVAACRALPADHFAPTVPPVDLAYLKSHLPGLFIGLIPPGQTVRRPAPPEWQRSYVEPEPVPIEFLDSAGRRWLRDEQGALARIDR